MLSQSQHVKFDSTVAVCSLDGLEPNAYEAFQASRNLKDVVDRVLKNKTEAWENGKPGLAKRLNIKASLMTPVLPMLVSCL